MIPLIVPLMACAPADAGNRWGDRPNRPDTCGAAAFAHLIGQPRGVLEGLDLPERVRIITPMQPVTMDHQPDRLNVDVDGDGVITGLRCG